MQRYQDNLSHEPKIKLDVARRDHRPALADEAPRVLLPPQVDGQPTLELAANQPVTGSAWRWTRACTTVLRARRPAYRKAR